MGFVKYLLGAALLLWLAAPAHATCPNYNQAQPNTTATNLSVMTADRVNITGGCINGIDVTNFGLGGGNPPGGSSGDIQTNAGGGAFGAITPGTGIATFLAVPSSANLLTGLTTKTGTGLAVFGTSPSLTTPTIAGATLSGTLAGSPTFSGAPLFTGLSAGTQTKCLGLDSSNNLVYLASACGSGGGGTTEVGVGVQGGQSPSNIGDNTTALPSGHYYYATNVAMTAQRTHNLPDSATQAVGDIEIFDAQQTATATNQLCVAAAGTDKVNTVTNGTVCITTAGGSIYLHNDGAGSYTTGAATNIPAPTNAQLIVGKTGSPSNTLAAVTLSQDCTITNAGVITCTKTNNVSFTALATTTPGTGVATAAAAALSANGGLTTTIASGAKALATGAISSAACTSAQTDTATNTATTDVVLASFNGDPTAVTGYVPLTAGMLTIIAYPTSNTVNFKVCNNSTGSITPGAITLNWRVVR